MNYMHSSIGHFKVHYQCPVCGEEAIFKKRLFGNGFYLYKRVSGKLINITPPEPINIKSMVRKEVTSYLKALQARHKKTYSN